MRGSPGTGAAGPWAAPSVAPVTACPLGRTYSGPVMCRLFALRSDQPVTADLWLLDAPYSLLHQSRFNADGTGLGWIDERGQARLRKRDRKSTRLNSSHVAISYAVFCLKKKKGMHRIDQLLLELAEAGDQAGR